MRKGGGKMVDKICLRIDGKKYEWKGYLGTVIRSYENGVSEGDVRAIRHTLFYAFSIERHRFKKNQVDWSTFDSSAEKLRELKREFLGGI